MILGSAESEVPKLIIREIILEEFQRVWSQSTNVTDGRTDRQLIMAIPCCTTLRAVKNEGRMENFDYSQVHRHFLWVATEKQIFIKLNCSCSIYHVVNLWSIIFIIIGEMELLLSAAGGGKDDCCCLDGWGYYISLPLQLFCMCVLFFLKFEHTFPITVHL